MCEMGDVFKHPLEDDLLAPRSVPELAPLELSPCSWDKDDGEVIGKLPRSPSCIVLLQRQARQPARARLERSPEVQDKREDEGAAMHAVQHGEDEKRQQGLQCPLQ